MLINRCLVSEFTSSEKKRSESEKSLTLSNSKSSSSSVTSDDGLSAETPAYPLRMVAVVARYHEMKLKFAALMSEVQCDSDLSVSQMIFHCDFGYFRAVVRKSRSKNFRRSDYGKTTSCGKPVEVSFGCASETTEASSCLSSSSSAVSSARSGGGKKEASGRDLKIKPPVKSALMRRRAEAIMRLLSNGCTSEVRIRQLLGDSPDTSKALRM
ncbi:hypothetical protein U1Q18_012895 [Sarracenia purpurea var. burkii]